MGIGHNIRDRRQELEMSQQKLGRKVGVAQQRVAYIETTDADLKYRVIRQYADALETTVDALIADNGGSDAV